jgi:hypothetical protein
VLRHENAVLRRNTGRVQYEPADRVWFAALTRFIQIRRKPVLSGLINKIRASRLKPEKAQVKAGILFSSGTGSAGKGPKATAGRRADSGPG